MRVGIPLISALADRAEFWSAPGVGTEVRMAFTSGDSAGSTPILSTSPDVQARPDRWLRGDPAAPGQRGESARGWLNGDVVAFVSPNSLLSGVLGRVCSVVAVRAQFTVDRHSDLALVTDAIAAQVVRMAPPGGVGFSVVVLERRLELTIGPLPAGSASGLRSASCAVLEFAEHALSPLVRLTDGLDVERAHDGEMLSVLMLERRPPAREPATGISPRR
jgi:hypothetical protein